MHGLSALLALASPLTVAGWTLTWYSDAKCTEPLGHIEDGDTISRGGNFDSNVASLITNFDSSKGEMQLTSDELHITQVANAGACMDWSVGVSSWSYSASI
ncbi:uncharacterized protein N7469_007980 [Penicillium citrinum]|uniref:Uncharacterized protein n=2 Tax=Penicillium TaxID=5073 RepID=A0A9W9TIW2_PENCI|nr:uncharacterized protein N7469_007980 [Penicillium citrinum]KAJ5224477.1 hypothetical protein N7469_007980 [Penicillium citrinum]KAJ5574729.1 hypothetical protein N7450_008628 [Penicillium hetheringtonii]KAK5796027.1 hypothetical protein VI817_005312 [Penicillium citrinum]